MYYELYGRFENRWLMVGEAVLIAAVSAIIFIILIFAVPDCKPISGTHTTEAPHHLPINATGGGLPLGNSTIDDVIAMDDVTRTTTGITHAGEHENHDDEHQSGHGKIFQVRIRNTLDLHDSYFGICLLQL